MPKKNVVEINEESKTNDAYLVSRNLEGTFYVSDEISVNGQLDNTFYYMKKKYPEYAEYLVHKDYSGDQHEYITGVEFFKESSVGLDENNDQYKDHPNYFTNTVNEYMSAFLEMLNISDEKKDEFKSKLGSEKNQAAFMRETLQVMKEKASAHNELLALNDDTIDFSQLNLASKTIADTLGFPDLFADVEEMTVSTKDGETRKGYFVKDTTFGKFTSESTYKEMTQGEQPKRKRLCSSVDAKKEVCNMSAFLAITGNRGVNSSDFEYLPDNRGDILKLTMVKNSYTKSYVEMTKNNIAGLLRYTTPEMANAIENLDVDILRNNLVAKGTNEKVIDIVIGNVNKAKEVIKEGKEYFKANPDAEVDGNHAKIMDDEDFKALQIDSKKLSTAGLLLGEIREEEFHSHGKSIADAFKKDTKKITGAELHNTISFDKETEDLMDAIANDERRTFFGLIKIGNSDEFQNIVDGIERLKEAKTNPEINVNDVVEQLDKACKDYIGSHKNPISGDGIYRLETVTALSNKLKGTVDVIERENAEEWSLNPNHQRNICDVAKMMLINEGRKVEDVLNMQDGEIFADRKLYMEAGHILFNAYRGKKEDLTALAEEYRDVMENVMDNRANEIGSDNRSSLKNIGDFSRSMADFFEDEFELECDMSSITMASTKLEDKMEAAYSRKMEEIDVTLSMLKDFVRKDKDLSADLSEFYIDELFTENVKEGATFIFQNEMDSKDPHTAQAVADVLLAAKLKEELSKEEPDKNEVLFMVRDYLDKRDEIEKSESVKKILDKDSGLNATEFLNIPDKRLAKGDFATSKELISLDKMMAPNKAVEEKKTKVQQKERVEEKGIDKKQ